MASETLHSGVQLLSLYHDVVLERAAASAKLRVPRSPPAAPRQPPSLHTRYTRHWSHKSALYRRAALVLSVVRYTELLIEMAAARRGRRDRNDNGRTRWRAVVLIEAIKAACKLAMWRATANRPLVEPPLPLRERVPEDEDEDVEVMAGGVDGDVASSRHAELNSWLAGDDGGQQMNGSARPVPPAKPAHAQPWLMPRTGSVLPPLPTPPPSSPSSVGSSGFPHRIATDSHQRQAEAISAYLGARVLTPDDIKPPPRLLRILPRGPAQLGEALHILAPLVFALALYRSHVRHSQTPSRPEPLKDWTPWLLGLATELAARALRDRALDHEASGWSAAWGRSAPGAGGSVGGGGRFRETALEREEASRRSWALLRWAMRGAMYGNVVGPWLVDSVAHGRWVPGIVGQVVEDWAYLWGNYYFATSES